MADWARPVISRAEAAKRPKASPSRELDEGSYAGMGWEPLAPASPWEGRGEARPEMSPPLPHDVGYLSALTRRAATLLVSHSALAQALEALHVLIGRREWLGLLRWRYWRPMAGRRPSIIIGRGHPARR